MILELLLTSMTAYAEPQNKFKYTMTKPKIKRPEELLGNPRPDEEFLQDVAFLESTNGQNLDHKIMDSGLHAKTKASGQFGVMPNTARETATRLKNRDALLNLDPSFSGDPEVEQLSDPSIPDDLLQFMLDENPEITNRIARYMGNLVDNRYKQDPEQKMYAWHHGHNRLKPATPEQLNKSNHIQKYRELQKFKKIKNMIKPQ
jgi:hypothetical protein